MIAELIPKIAGMEREEMRPYFPRPSIAGPERCIRQMVYWASGTDKDRELSGRALVVFDDSSWHEELTANWIAKTAFKLHSSQMGIDVCKLDFVTDTQFRECKDCKGKPIPPYMLHGHCDGILTDILMGDYMYEHKAINHFQFNRYWKGDWPLDYFTQVCEYILGTQKDLPDLENGLLLVKNKNTSQYIDYRMKYDRKRDWAGILEVAHSNGDHKFGAPYLFEMEGVIQGVKDKFALVDEHAKGKTLPDRPFEYGTDFPCGYCLWENTCWEGYAEEVESLAVDVQLTEEITALCGLYLEETYHENEAKSHKEDLKKKIKELLKLQGARKGKAGEYIVENRMQFVERIKSRDEIPLHLLPMLIKKTSFEVLSVRKAREKK